MSDTEWTFLYQCYIDHTVDPPGAWWYCRATRRQPIGNVDDDYVLGKGRTQGKALDAANLAITRIERRTKGARHE